MINFTDAGSDAGTGVYNLFTRTREAVEAAVLAFGLSRPGTPLDARQSVSRGREYLALTLSERSEDADDAAADDGIFEFFAPQLNDAWIAKWRQDFDELKGKWAKVERLAIGANHALVMERRDRAGGEHAPVTEANPAAGDGASLEKYLHDLMRDLAKGAIKLFFPSAVRYIQDASQEAPEGVVSRVPSALRLHLCTCSTRPGRR